MSKPEGIVKEFKAKGNLQLFKRKPAQNFTCTNCQREKKSKCFVVVDKKWEKIICTGCYGILLSKRKEKKKAKKDKTKKGEEKNPKKRKREDSVPEDEEIIILDKRRKISVEEPKAEDLIEEVKLQTPLESGSKIVNSTT